MRILKTGDPCPCCGMPLKLTDPDAFAAVAAEPDLSPHDGASWYKPDKEFQGRGGCPFYMGELLSGSRSTVLCDAVRPQLHSYVEVKFCEEGRKVCCPIWRAAAPGAGRKGEEER